MDFDKSNPVKLRLLRDVPVDVKYGLTEGSEIVAYPEIISRRSYPQWWYPFQEYPESPVDHVGILLHEAEVIT